MTSHQSTPPHTPGPWHVQVPMISREPGANNHGYYILYATQGNTEHRTREIAHCLITSVYEDCPTLEDERECQANVQLLAIAPELLSLTKTFRAACLERMAILKEELKEEWCNGGDIEDQIEDFIDEQIWHWNALLNKCNEVIAKMQLTHSKSRLARSRQDSR